MRQRSLSFCLIYFVIFSATTGFSQEPLWKGKGRIIVSADGNEHDHDDWAATPLTLAIVAAKGLQDKLPLYIYSDHIWGSNHEHPGIGGISPYDQMKESALVGKKMFGFKKTKFICAIDNRETAYKELTTEINKSAIDNPLFIIVAGPLQVIGEAISRADRNKLQFITIISTVDKWNNTHADEPYSNWENHSGWTLDEIKNNFVVSGIASLTIIQIKSQNIGLKRNWKEYEWLKTEPKNFTKYYKKGSWLWLFNRLSASTKPMGTDRDYYYAIDASDAGKMVFLLTGIDDADPKLCRELLTAPLQSPGE